MEIFRKPVTTYAVVMAGGQGTRLWPLSRISHPKQFLRLTVDGRSLLQAAVDRAGRVVGDVNQVLMVAPVKQAELIREQLPGFPDDNLILEPLGRNTAAAIGLAAIHIQQRNPEAVMGVFPADHLFKDEKPWIDAVQTALEFAVDSDFFVTIGLAPATPSPSYGYLHLGRLLSFEKKLPVFDVRRFVEKPTIDVAQNYLDSREYLWNTGTFAWKVSTLLRGFEHHLPEHYAGLQKIAEHPDAWNVLANEYQSLDSISIDYGLMERSSNVAAVQADFERIDLGNLSDLSNLFSEDTNRNTLKGQGLIVDGKNNLIYDDADQGITVIFGIDDLILVRHDDVVLVLPKNEAHRIKDLLVEIRQRGLKQYL